VYESSAKHRNNSRSNNSLKTSASQSILSGQSIRSKSRSMNKHRNSIHLLHNRDRWNSSEGTIKDYYLQHGETTHQTLSSNIWRVKSTQMNQNIMELYLKSKKTRFEINNNQDPDQTSTIFIFLKTKKNNKTSQKQNPATQQNHEHNITQSTKQQKNSQTS